MNEHVRPQRGTTQAAEGLPRLRWTIDDIDQMLEAGVLTEDDRVELIGGELVPMSPKGPLHEAIKLALTRWLRKSLPDELDYLTELGWRPDKVTYCEPDVLIFPARTSPSKVPPADVFLAIEIADTSERYDLGTKASVYAGLGVREYWVLVASSLTTIVHREPGTRGYGAIREVPATETLAPSLLPGVTLCVADLEIVSEE